MRFSKKSEYGLRAMIELTQEYGRELVQRKVLADRQKIPLGFLEMILILVWSGLTIMSVFLYFLWSAHRKAAVSLA